MTHKDAGQAGSGEQVKRYSVQSGFVHETAHGSYVKVADYDRLSAENATMRAALEWLYNKLSNTHGGGELRSVIAEALSPDRKGL